MRKERYSSLPFPFLCFGDLPRPWTARIVQCRSVAVTHVMCWRGLRRKQRRQEGVILVRSPVRVGVRPHVKGWACLAQNTDCTSSTNLSTKTPLGGWRGRRCYNVEERWEGSKLPLNSWAEGEGCLYTGENKRMSGREGRGGEEHISRFSSCNADLAEATPNLPFSILPSWNPPCLPLRFQ